VKIASLHSKLLLIIFLIVLIVPARPGFSGRAVFATSSIDADARLSAAADTIVEPTAKNIEVVGHIGGEANAIFVQGTYVYIGFGPALAIVDASDPSHPVQRGYIVLPGMVQDIFVAGGYAYIAAYDAGFRVVDISDPNAPREVGAYDTPRPALGIAVGGSYGYVVWSACLVVSGNACDGGLEILSLLDPAMPVEIGSYQTGWPLNKDVALVGRYAYIANDLGLATIDISNPTAPALAGSILLEEEEFIDQIAVSGAYAYLGGNKLWIVNISNPAKPINVGSYNSPVGGVAVAGRFAYIVDEGLTILDISRPSRIAKVGFYDTSGANRRVAVAGNYAYLAAGNKGLRIAVVAKPTAPIEVGFYDPPRVQRATDVAVAGDYAYVIDEQSSSGEPDGALFIVDISNPATPVTKGFFDKLGQPQDVAVVGSYAYVADGGHGLRIIDVSNPAAPTEAMPKI
jgi:hypothetical protein